MAVCVDLIGEQSLTNSAVCSYLVRDVRAKIDQQALLSADTKSSLVEALDLMIALG